MARLYHCADERNAALAAMFQDEANTLRHTRTDYSEAEIPAGQSYKTDLVEMVGLSTGVADCRMVLPSARLHPAWLANEIAGFARREEEYTPPAVLQWVPEEEVRRYHHLSPEGFQVRPYGFDGDVLARVVENLKDDPESKRCVYSFHKPSYVNPAEETPCATTVQFLLRSGALWAVASYRSHDFFAGNVTDPIRTSAVQQVVATELSRALGEAVRPGPLVVQDGSLHYYPAKNSRGMETFAESSRHKAWDSCTSQPFDLEGVDSLALRTFASIFQGGPRNWRPSVPHREPGTARLFALLDDAVAWWRRHNEPGVRRPEAP